MDRATGAFLYMLLTAMPHRADLPGDAVSDLVARRGIHGPYTLQPLPGGRNNKVYHVQGDDQTLLLKAYFHHPNDPRNRLRQEYEFLSYLWSSGVSTAPRPIVADYEHHLGLYEFVFGRKLALVEIETQHIDRAISFYQAMNSAKFTDPARRLPQASEAGFSVVEHLGNVNRRVEQLSPIEATSEVDREAHQFFLDELRPFWVTLFHAVASVSRQHGNFDTVLDESARCLSPSDFGYHNAIQEASGRLRFLDFEYAGWDDPAKLVCDFANQPDMLLPEELTRRFEDAVIAADVSPEHLRQRIQWLTPAYQIKWACIILNDFLPAGRSRSKFLGGEDDKERKQVQLSKARSMFSRATISSREVNTT